MHHSFSLKGIWCWLITPAPANAGHVIKSSQCQHEVRNDKPVLIQLSCIPVKLPLNWGSEGWPFLLAANVTQFSKQHLKTQSATKTYSITCNDHFQCLKPSALCTTSKQCWCTTAVFKLTQIFAVNSSHERLSALTLEKMWDFWKHFLSSFLFSCLFLILEFCHNVLTLLLKFQIFYFTPLL